MPSRRGMVGGRVQAWAQRWVYRSGLSVLHVALYWILQPLPLLRWSFSSLMRTYLLLRWAAVSWLVTRAKTHFPACLSWGRGTLGSKEKIQRIACSHACSSQLRAERVEIRLLHPFESLSLSFNVLVEVKSRKKCGLQNAARCQKNLWQKF
jgi:hypothetical protein